MKLYYEDVLSPRKVCALAHHLKSPVEFVRVSFEKGENRKAPFLAINPNGKVPALANGHIVLWEANAILCHLACEAGSNLWPDDPARQIDIVRWFSWETSHFNRAAGALYFEHIIKPRFGIGAPDALEVQRATEDFRNFAGVLDRHLAEREWLLGKSLSVADFATGIALPYAEEAQIPIDEFPNVLRWHDRLNRLEGWRNPWPHLQAEAA